MIEETLNEETEDNEKKKVKVPECKYNSGVCCELNARRCSRCGFNPVVDEMRKTAIRLGEKHFLRYTDRDFGKYEAMLSEIQLGNAAV